MTSIPCYCRNCGVFTIENPFGAGNSTIIEMEDNVAKCPRCGSLSEVIDGVYQQIKDGTYANISETASPEAQQALLNLLRAVADGTTDLDEARHEAEKIAPKSGELFDRLASMAEPLRKALLSRILGGALLTSIGAYVGAQSASPPVVYIQNIIQLPQNGFNKNLLGSTSLSPPIPRPRPSPPIPRPRPKQ